VIDRTATARIQRLMRWLESFQRCFGHRAQRLALRTYVHGVFSDSDRKSMQAMLARVTQPVSYQAFQHFITHAQWDSDRVWRRLLEILPERRGVLILDGTSFPKQGRYSVAVARQYCGALGKIANCQVAVTAALNPRCRRRKLQRNGAARCTAPTSPTRICRPSCSRARSAVSTIMWHLH
jgi:SRSO17 transposase